MTKPLASDQIFIRKLTDITLANLGNENFGVKELLHESGMTYFSLSRRLHNIANKTINQFIRETRLTKALEMLQNEQVTASEVAYKTGFSSPAYFTKCFHEYFGYPPGKVKNGDSDNQEELNPVQFWPIQEQKRAVQRTYFIASSGIIFLIIIIFLINSVSLKNSSTNAGISVKNPEKSIAVLPFKNLSDSTANKYFIDGLMDEILTNLSRIHDLRVISRTSVEQFRESTKSTSEIAKKLNADYIVEGSGQKYGNSFRLRIQLIEASSDKHIWAESYEQEIRETKDIFKIQSQVAQSIATKLNATITPEEKHLMENTPTLNLTAYDFYQRGRDELNKEWIDIKTLNRAKEMFDKALEYDSAFAPAYIGLSDVYGWRYGRESYYSKNYLDSFLILVDLALSYDDHLAEGYFGRAVYYINNGKMEEAIKEYGQALRYNPNYWDVYFSEGQVVYLLDYNNMDFVKGLEYLHKAASIYHGRMLPFLLRELGDAYGIIAGFPEHRKNCYQEAFKLDADSNAYFNYLAGEESSNLDYKKALGLYNLCYLRDSNDVRTTKGLADTYCSLGQYKESLKYIKKLEKRLDDPTLLLFNSYFIRIGYVYWENGNRKEADHWFNEQKRMSEESLKMGRAYSIDANYDLAAMYAFIGEKEKAYENLRIFAKIHVCPLSKVTLIKTDPLFNSIRNETEFKSIVNNLEARYMAEHERVSKWLEVPDLHSPGFTDNRR